MPKRILVPLDGSLFSEHALPVASRLAREAGAQLYLIQVHESAVGGVYPNGVPAFDTRWNEALRTNEAEYLRDAASRCAIHAGVVTHTELIDGIVPGAIARYAEELDIDLIVMTTHGRGGISRAWIGSVADALVRRVELPVMLIRPRHEQVSWEETAPLHHVLIPLDGSELSESVIEHALTVGQLTQASYTLLRVVLPVPFFAATNVATPAIFAEKGAIESAAEAGEYVEQIADALRARGFQTDVATVVHSLPSIAIHDYAATRAVDGIAMATHGRGGWSRLALGSVADSVMRGTTLPILLYRTASPRPLSEQLDRVAAAVHV